MPKPKIILGIETSCDETAAAVLQKQGNRIQILSNVVASSAGLQAKYGGIIPEQAAREQIKSIVPVIQEALLQAFPNHPTSDIRLLISELDAIAVTQGPGLIGSLLVGVETAKTLSLIWNKPLIPVNHLMGHFYANWIEIESGDKSLESGKNPRLSTLATGHYPKFPCIGLLVSGGHTDLILMKSHTSYEYLGGTRDDAAGECFDKCARLLGLPYPGGPEISKLAKNGNPKAYKLPRPMIDTKDFDFSFSGLKTAVANLVISEGWREWGSPVERPQRVKRARTSDGGDERQDPEQIHNLCASIEQAILDVLVKKTATAAQKYNIEQIIVAGGVAANQKLSSDLKLEIRNLKLLASLRGRSGKIDILTPPPYLCTDNGAMIAARAFYEKPIKNPLSIQANPGLSLY